MARSLWTGSLSFGLVNVPVALFSATRDLGVHFRQLHEPDGSPIEMRRVCTAEDREVPWSEIAKGYELDDGRWVLLTDEDLEAAAPRRSRTIDIERFVAEEEIDPIYYEHHYLLAPREEAAGRAYALLSEVMASSQRVALGRFVLRAKESLVSVRSRAGALTLSTMRFHDEIRDSGEIAGGEATAKPRRAQVESAVAVIEELSVAFEPEGYRDEHRERLLQIVESKRKGRKIEAPSKREEPAPTAAPDLTRALEQSLERIRAEGTPQHPARRREPEHGHGGRVRSSSSRRRRETS